MSESKEGVEYWDKRWVDGQFGFHLKEVHPYLKEFIHHLVSESTNGKRILVPFCGKTLDLKYLYDLGLTVIGIEYSDIAVKSFFQEHTLEFDVKELNNCKVYSYNERLKVYQGDLFCINSQTIGGKCDYHWDRGGLIAMEYCDHEKYVEHIKSLLGPSSVSLIECFEYDPTLRNDPPRCVKPDQLKLLFGNQYTFKELRRDKGDNKPSMLLKYQNLNENHVVHLVKKI